MERLRLGRLLVVVGMLVGMAGAQTVSYPSWADTQGKFITWSTNMNHDGMDAINSLMGTLQGEFNKYDGAIQELQGFMGTYKVKVDAQTATISAMAQQITQQNTAIDAATKTANNALAYSQEFTAAFPCAVMNLRVEVDVTGQRTMKWETPTPTCTGIVQGGYVGTAKTTGLQIARAQCPINQVVPLDLQALVVGSTFSYPMPSTWPVQGCFVAYSYDASGNLQFTKQVEYGTK